MTDKATPRPWKVFSKNRIWYAGNDPEIGTVEIAKFGDMTDKELIPFNAQRWFADCALAVQAVNSFDEREALLREAAGLLLVAATTGEDDDMVGQFRRCRARIRTALGETPALPDTGEKN